MYKRQKELKPQSLEDVIAGISLYRPGPMDFSPQYIRGKNRPDTIRYDCPQMEPILKPTYGCIVYQEPVSYTHLSMLWNNTCGLYLRRGSMRA